MLTAKWVLRSAISLLWASDAGNGNKRHLRHEQSKISGVTRMHAQDGRNCGFLDPELDSQHGRLAIRDAGI